MGSGDIIVGKGQQPPEPRQSIVVDKAENDADLRRGPAKPRQAQMCGAMTQQDASSGAISQPQEFVRLVGCRERKVRQQGDH